MNGEVRVGVVGAGAIGRLHIGAYEKAGAKVVAIADVDAAAATAAAESCNATVYTDHEEMLAREELQAISVCTPPAMHRAAAVAGAERGLAVLCEKPMAESADAARELAEAVSAAGVPFMVGFFHRFHEPLVTLRQIVSEGTFGQPIVVRTRFSLVGSEDKRPWVGDVAVSGGGEMMNSAVHSLDIVRFLTGAEASVQGAVVSYGAPRGALENTALVLLSGDRGDLAIVEAYGAAPARAYELWVGGEHGEATVSWDPPGLRLRMAGETEWKEMPTSALTRLDRIDRGIAYFCVCVEARRPVEEATGVDGVRAIELAQSAYQAAGAHDR